MSVGCWVEEAPGCKHPQTLTKQEVERIAASLGGTVEPGEHYPGFPNDRELIVRLPEGELLTRASNGVAYDSFSIRMHGVGASWYAALVEDGYSIMNEITALDEYEASKLSNQHAS